MKYRKRGWILAVIPLAAAMVALIQYTKKGDLTGDRQTPVDGFTLAEDFNDPFTDVYNHYWGGSADGDIPFMSFILANQRYPEEAVRNNEKGEVIVEFIRSERGRIEENRVKQGVSESPDREAVRTQYWVPIVFSPDYAETMNATGFIN